MRNKNNVYNVVNQKSVDVLNKVLSRKNYNTWVMHTGPHANVYILRKQYGRKAWTNVIKVVFPHRLMETDAETNLEAVMSKYCKQNLWS